MGNPYDNLNDTFNVKPEEALSKNLKKTTDNMPLEVDPASLEKVHDRQLENDFQEARERLKKAADYGEEALQGVLNVAKSSDHPRAYEVAGQLVKAMQDNAKDLIDVQEKARKIKYGPANKAKVEKQTNNVFIGSTAELLKTLKNEKDITPDE